MSATTLSLSRLKVDLLGGLGVSRSSGEAITIPAKKARALLAFLAFNRGRGQPRERVAAMLWEGGEQQARASLRQALSVLRQSLALSDDELVAGGDDLVLAPGCFEVDALQFEQLVENGSAPALEQAVALYHGEFMESFSTRAPLADGLEPRALAPSGRDPAQRAWSLKSLRARPIFGHAALVGREGELQQFTAALEACRSANRGMTICVRGSAGIGKLRLSSEFAAIARAAGFATHSGFVLDFGGAREHSASRMIAHSLLGTDAGDEQAVRAAAARWVTDAGRGEDALVHANVLLGLSQPSALRPVLDAMDQATRVRGAAQLQSRMDRLGEHARNVLQAASVLGVKPGDRIELEEGPDGFDLRARHIDRACLAPLRGNDRVPWRRS